MSSSFDFAQAPGHLIRRAQQIAVAEFVSEMAAFDITPVQFALLNALIDTPGVDQITLAKKVAFDPATLGSVIGRLEVKKWVRRESDAQDRRRKRLFVSADGLKAARQMQAAGEKVQRSILAPLKPQEQRQFMDLLTRLVSGHEGAADQVGA